MKIRLNKKMTLNVRTLMTNIAILVGVCIIAYTIIDFASHPADFCTTGTWKHLFGG